MKTMASSEEKPAPSPVQDFPDPHIPAQDFVISRAKGAQWAEKGLRNVFRYRDLGIETATKGAFGAQVISAKEAVASAQGRHHHSLTFQMVYILTGSIRFYYEGQGEVTLGAGDSVLQPPGIRHEILGCSEDMTLLEITSPAEFATKDD